MSKREGRYDWIFWVAIGVGAMVYLATRKKEPVTVGRAMSEPVPMPRRLPGGIVNAARAQRPPKPSESDPRFQSALARYNATQAPGYIGVSYGRPQWSWTGDRWSITQAV